MADATLARDILVSVEQKIPGGLSAEDWTLLQQILDLIRGAIPPGSNSPPAKVFGVIKTALRGHFARQIRALIDLRRLIQTARVWITAIPPCAFARGLLHELTAPACWRMQQPLGPGTAFGSRRGAWSPRW